MLQFRAQGEMNVERWMTILDESFELILPITPYRSFSPRELLLARRHVTGMEALLADTSSFIMMVQSITPVSFLRTEHDTSQRVSILLIFKGELIVSVGCITIFYKP